MSTAALRADDLRSLPGGGFELRVGLPWIRSMPLSSVRDLTVVIDGRARAVTVELAGRSVAPDRLVGEPSWWFIQDRIVLAGTDRLDVGTHEVVVAFALMIPYLYSSPGEPLILPIRLVTESRTDA